MLRQRLTFITISIFIFVTHVSCVVTNKIGFEEEVNSPLTVLEFNPLDTNQTIEVDADDDVIFSIMVWDPDENVRGSIRARLYISRESDSVEAEHQVRNCEATAAQDPLSTVGISEDYTGNGTLSEVTCSENPYYIVLDSPPETLVSVRMEVSDLGYTGEDPTEEAYTVDVAWLYRVVE